jgi:integrase
VKGFKRCKCREDGRELGASCPKLRRRDNSWNPAHGTWYGKTELPSGPGGERVSLRAGGFASQDEMTEWFDEALHLLSIPEKGPDGHEVRVQILAMIRESRRRKESLPPFDEMRRRYAAGVAFSEGDTGDYLLGWLDRHERAGDWSDTTAHSYRRTVERLFLPAFGTVPLGKLSAKHILDMFEEIDRANARLLAAKASDDPDVRRTVAGQRPTGPATKRRILAVLNSALGEAATAAPGRPQVISVNPGAGIRLNARRKKATPRIRPKLWTAERERVWREKFAVRIRGMSRLDQFQAWRSTPARPGPVMVWRPDQLGAFLDAAEDERLYALFCVVAYCALRRGEAVGQKLAEVDYEAGALMIGPTIVQVGGKAVAKEDAKTDGSETWVRAGPEVMEPLRAQRQRQIAEKLRWGPDGRAAPGVAAGCPALRADLRAGGREGHQGGVGDDAPHVGEDHGGHLRPGAPRTRRGGVGGGRVDDPAAGEGLPVRNCRSPIGLPPADGDQHTEAGKPVIPGQAMSRLSESNR